MNIQRLDTVPNVIINEELCVKKRTTGIERGAYRHSGISKHTVAPAVKTGYATSYDKNEYPRSVFNRRSVSFNLESSIIIRQTSINSVENAKNRSLERKKDSGLENLAVKRIENGLENALCRDEKIPYVDANLLYAKAASNFSLGGSNASIESGVYGHSLKGTAHKVFKVIYFQKFKVVCFFLFYDVISRVFYKQLATRSDYARV